ALQNDDEGTLWMGTTKGLMRYITGQAVAFSDRSLMSDVIMTLFKDRQGNVWVGTLADGVDKSPGNFIVSYTRADGMHDEDAGFVVEGGAGTIYAASSHHLLQVRNGKLTIIGASPPFRGLFTRMLHDSRDNYWLSTNEGLYRVTGPELDLRRAKKVGEA